MQPPPKDEIRDALQQLERLIADRVRHEQRRHQLTGLPNRLALEDAIAERIRNSSKFWAAFVEIDRFKSLNQRFGHGNANAMLRQIAEMMHTMCSCFHGETAALHAHGDEFFFVGDLAGSVEELEDALVLVKQNVRAIKIPVERIGTMSCTVSIGWLTGSDLTCDPTAVVTERTVFDALERAVAEAKRKRDDVVRYGCALEAEDWVALRTDCRSCGCKFAIDVERSKLASSETLACPNCRADVERPFVEEHHPIAPAEII